MRTPDDAPDDRAPRSPEALVARLLQLLNIEEIDINLYRGARRARGQGRVFGGQVIAQGLTAAMRSVETEAAAHSLHAYFMRAGDESLPIIYRVERDFDGRSFATRRVIALQRGQPILNMAASFHRTEPGFEHQAEMPAAPEPESLLSEAELSQREREKGDLSPRAETVLSRVRPIEVRPVEPRSLLHPTPHEPRSMIWFRAAAPIGDDPDVHRAVLAYASDMGLLGASMLPHGVSFLTHGMQAASLDHALWLHADFRVDDWLLYVMESPWAAQARGFNRGQIFNRKGKLVASVAQEGLVRMRRAERPSLAADN
ncbi:acyl-CoA thioesterase [Lichenicoccus sp.]|uniref:acyl-CoA thioesterase n=1 Tax=Lichenicoccus sp. TaxID=2781899 RepID=UPI003D0CDB05